MVVMTFEQKNLLYDCIETAVKEKAAVELPENVYPVLQVGRSATGLTFTIPGLLWMDDRRNVYHAWMQIEYRSRAIQSPALYVAGSATPDGFNSGDVSMIKKEKRYRTII